MSEFGLLRGGLSKEFALECIVINLFCIFVGFQAVERDGGEDMLRYLGEIGQGCRRMLMGLRLCLLVFSGRIAVEGCSFFKQLLCLCWKNFSFGSDQG
jgi:hypothetical protein